MNFIITLIINHLQSAMASARVNFMDESRRFGESGLLVSWDIVSSSSVRAREKVVVGHSGSAQTRGACRGLGFVGVPLRRAG